MQDKTHGLEGKPQIVKSEKVHWFLNDKMLNLERRIVILEEKAEKLLKDWQALQTMVERVLGEWSDK